MTEEQVKANLMFTGERPFDCHDERDACRADAETWFGRAPPDLSLIARAKGTDYVFQFLKTFYLDRERPHGREQPRARKRRDAARAGRSAGPAEGGVRAGENERRQWQRRWCGAFDHFEQVTPGRLSAAEYDEFVRDTVNFLDYVSEPVRAKRESLGIWVVLFLIVFTGFAWALKKEIWKDVH